MAGLTCVSEGSWRCADGTSYTSLLIFGTEARHALGRVNRCLDGEKKHIKIKIKQAAVNSKLRTSLTIQLVEQATLRESPLSD